MPDTEDGEIDDVTNSTDVRWAYLASVITAIVIIGFLLIIGLAAAGILSLSAISQGWFILTATVVLMAAAWLWGTDTLEAVRESRPE